MRQTNNICFYDILITTMQKITVENLVCEKYQKEYKFMKFQIVYNAFIAWFIQLYHVMKLLYLFLFVSFILFKENTSIKEGCYINTFWSLAKVDPVQGLMDGKVNLNSTY